MSPRLVAAAAAVLLSLGLPWTTTVGAGSYGPGWFTPGSCTYDSSGYMSCSVGITTPGIYMPGALENVVGYASPARVMLVAALALIAVALRRPSERTVRWAAYALGIDVLLSGTALLTGSMAALIALALVILELRALRSGLPVPVPVLSTADDRV